MIAKYGPPFKIFTLVAQLVKNPPTMHETGFHPWVAKTPWRRDRLPTPVFLGFPGDSASKESVCNVGDLSSIPGLGRPPEEGKGYPLQYSGLKNSMDYIVHGVTKSWTQLSDFQDHLCHRTYHTLGCRTAQEGTKGSQVQLQLARPAAVPSSLPASLMPNAGVQRSG